MKRTLIAAAILPALWISALWIWVWAADGALAASANDMVVVKAQGVALKRGATIDGSQLLKLPAGAAVTLITADGSTVRLTGPVEKAPAEVAGKAGGGDAGMVTALSALVSAHENSSSALGVVRSGGQTVEIGPLPTPWTVSVDRSGAWCIQPDRVTLWRLDAKPAATLTIAPETSARVARLEWPAGQDKLVLGGKMFETGRTYALGHQGRTVMLTLHVLPPGIGSPSAQAGWMAKVGCEAQALALLATLP